MSVVVGVKIDDSISIACDTQSSRGSLKILDTYMSNHTKIFKFNESLIGITGWFALEQIFHHVLTTKPEILDFSSRVSIFESLLKIQGVFEEEYFVETSENDDQPVSSNQLTAIILNRHGLFDIDSYREVNQFTRFWAIGSGQELALGAMHALHGKGCSAKEIAGAGVQAACDFNDGCSAPINIETMQVEES
ncbi:hypothetical protein IIA29_01245 [candidate division KSB1 bacterium]|nr:hypothetical protein [candidate division KSB1 bacterium]